MPLEKKSSAAGQHDHLGRAVGCARTGRPRAGDGTGRCSSRRCRSRSSGSRRRPSPRRRSRGRCGRRRSARAPRPAISGTSSAMPAISSARVAGSLNCAGRPALEVGDPDRAVDGGAADRAVARGDDLAGTPAQAASTCDAEQVELDARDRVEHTGVPLGGADLAHHGGGGVERPVDRAVGLLISGRSRPITRGSS